MSYRKLPALLIPYLLFFVLYYPVLFADYAYLDEIHQLWHNHDGNNFSMFHTQGRWITGIWFNNLFATFSRIEEIKIARIISLSGALLFLLLWNIIFSKWATRFKLDPNLNLLTSIFIVCGASTTIYIGWASCFEIFFGLSAGLLSGHCLLDIIYNKERNNVARCVIGVASFLCGIISLFIYQNTFGIFVFPFLIYYTRNERVMPDRSLIVAVLFYLFVYVVYYLLFKYSLTLYDIPGNDRVGITTDYLRKLSFLFSGPLPTAFSVNMLYSARSIFSQILAPMIMLAWAVSIFFRYKNRKFYNNILYLVAILVFLVLIYLPSMIAKENFASYRTMFVFNLAVFYLVCEAVLYIFKNRPSRKIVVVAISIFVVITGYYNYNWQFVNPLKSEYKAFQQFMQKNVTANTDTFLFVRADRFMFSHFFYVRPYTDEIGAPSTSRDWVAEPLIKQTLFEATKDRKLADKITVLQFENIDEYNAKPIKLSERIVFIDMNTIFSEYMKRNE